MKVGLFIPCYIDQFYPKVGVATLEILERLGLEVIYPANQTCCGQPMANAGFEHTTDELIQFFIFNFHKFDYVVAPSSSCIYHMKEQLKKAPQTEPVKHLLSHVFELCEFITDELKITDLGASMEGVAGLLNSCHGLRGLNNASSSELVEKKYSKPLSLLEKVDGLQVREIERQDECCGFGGIFSVKEETISAKMGVEKLWNFMEKDIQIITSTDMSCLMHLDGLIKRQSYDLKVMHIAEILNSRI